MSYLDNSRQLLQDLKVKGCEIQEIVDLEKTLDIFLPEAYKEFLLWMGKDTSTFLKCSEVQYNNLIKIQKTGK